jgi:HK97 family phage major capsid protein
LGGANAKTYRATLDGSFEFEEDAFEVGLKLAENAFSIGMARGIGQALVTGSGSGAPQGVLTGSVFGATALNPNKLVLDDFESLFFSVDRIYRVSDKCAWVMNDTTYKQVRRAVDNNGRPLINIRKDKEEIMGKPVLVSPSMPAFAASANVIVFGDLSHYVVYSSLLRVNRSIEAAGYVDYGKALYTALMRVDAGVFDPTNGSVAPLKYLTMSS